MNTELINQGLIVTAVGMVVVFVFLTLLVCAVNISRIFIPNKENETNNASENQTAISPNDDEDSDDEAEIAAAIAIAKAMS